MFSECYELKEIKGINKFNTNKVKNMSAMFQLCKELENIDLSNFITSNVTDMSYMFYKCNNLRNLNLSNFSINCNTEHMLEFKNKKKCKLITNNKNLLKLYKST